MPHELDRVELLERAAGWPPGTTGTVVDVPERAVVTVEISGAHRPAAALLLDAVIDVPASAVRVIAAPHAT